MLSSQFRGVFSYCFLRRVVFLSFFFFFQAEDGIRDIGVTGVQTCALPIFYLDTAFFREIETRFRGCDAGSRACQFSEAYVIAHEVGHHVQNLLGILPKVQQEQKAAANKTESNRLQVRVELQADCFAGVWANRSNKRKSFIDPGDVDQALQTASAIGDDTLQKQARGYVVPDAFTHGSAEQRKRWFMSGFNSGQVSACNTFTATSL